MTLYAITISYATTDRYYRGRRAFTLEARTEAEARRLAVRGTAGARVERIRVSARNGGRA